MTQDLSHSNRSVAPQRWGITSRGALPEQRWFTVAVTARRALLPRSGQGQNTASLKWLALKSDGPGAESPGKECRALVTAASLIVMGGGGRDDGVRGRGDSGYLVNISSKTSEEAGASPSEGQCL